MFHLCLKIKLMVNVVSLIGFFCWELNRNDVEMGLLPNQIASCTDKLNAALLEVGLELSEVQLWPS